MVVLMSAGSLRAHPGSMYSNYTLSPSVVALFYQINVVFVLKYSFSALSTTLIIVMHIYFLIWNENVVEINTNLVTISFLTQAN